MAFMSQGKIKKKCIDIVFKIGQILYNFMQENCLCQANLLQMLNIYYTVMNHIQIHSFVI